MTSCWRLQGSSERCAPSSPWPLGAPTRSLPGTRHMGTTCWRRCGGSTWTLPRCPDSDHWTPVWQLCALSLYRACSSCLRQNMHAGGLAAVLAAQCMPAFQHACCCDFGSVCALRAAIYVYACCLMTWQFCAGEIVEAGCSPHCRHGSSRCCKERQLAEDTCWRRHAG